MKKNKKNLSQSTLLILITRATPTIKEESKKNIRSPARRKQNPTKTRLSISSRRRLLITVIIIGRERTSRVYMEVNRERSII